MTDAPLVAQRILSLLVVQLVGWQIQPTQG
jgi:hypothetical protein